MPRRVEVVVRVTTPMFLGGARTRSEGDQERGVQFNPEARALSLKGAMRW